MITYPQELNYDKLDKLNSSLEKLEQWSNESSLAINAMKTKFLISGSKRLYDRQLIKEQTITL